jgi:hypothetical protein
METLTENQSSTRQLFLRMVHVTVALRAADLCHGARIPRIAWTATAYDLEWLTKD